MWNVQEHAVPPIISSREDLEKAHCSLAGNRCISSRPQLKNISFELQFRHHFLVRPVKSLALTRAYRMLCLGSILQTRASSILSASILDLFIVLAWKDRHTTNKSSITRSS